VDGRIFRGQRREPVLKPVRIWSCVAVLALLLPGCAALPGLGGTPELDTYELTAPTPEGVRRRGVQILIAEPSALKALDGENIVIKTAPGSIQYLKGAQWADRLPKVVQARLAESFQLSGRFGGVGKPGEGLAIDYQVIVDIRAFEVQVVAGLEQAYVELYVKILNDRNGDVRTSRTFEAASAVSGSGNEAYIQALDRAFGEAAIGIVKWTSRSI
jgi:cholesterol transport system auxiliary component